MPCVLPVIALKILGFVQQSKEEPQRVRKLGLVYGGGVLVSFLVLAALVIGIGEDDFVGGSWIGPGDCVGARRHVGLRSARNADAFAR